MIKELGLSQSWLEPITTLSMSSYSDTPKRLDVVLITHPRDEQDIERLFPWAKLLSTSERIGLTKCLKPTFGEIISTPAMNVGILFLPLYAREIMNPQTRSACREMLKNDALNIVANAGAGIICLGGLTGTLTQYGKQLHEYASKHGITITTGHATTAISVYRTYVKAIQELNFKPQSRPLAIVGLGSVGAAVAKRIVNSEHLPGKLLLIDKPGRESHLISIAESLKCNKDIEIEIELTSADGMIRDNSRMYDSSYIISAVSNPNVIDINKIAPFTVLIDDSQPYCWPREIAYKRCVEKLDIVPCEAGLIDCSAINYTSRFPFDFADYNQHGSNTAWCCLTEGLLGFLDNTLPNTIGEPSLENILKYEAAFDKYQLKPSSLQCGKHKLPMDQLRESFATR